MGNYAIGIDLGGTNLKAGLVDRDGKIHHRLSIKTENNADPQTISNQIFELIVKVGAGLKPAPTNIIGVGLGSPGLVDKKGETILFSPNLPLWRNIPIKRMVSERFSVPCVLENDANAAAWGRNGWEQERKQIPLVMLTLGTGIGGGIIINNKLWRGVNNVARRLVTYGNQMDGPEMQLRQLRMY